MVYTLCIVLIVIAALLMIGIVLIQESKGGGLSSQFSASNSIMGVRKTTDLVEKLTWGLAGFIVCVSIICAYVLPGNNTSESVLEQTATETQTTNPNTMPGFGAAQQQKASKNATPTPAAPAVPNTPAK